MKRGIISEYRCYEIIPKSIMVANEMQVRLHCLIAADRKHYIKQGSLSVKSARPVGEVTPQVSVSSGGGHSTNQRVQWGRSHHK